MALTYLLTGSQKALALPPGLALFSVSERAMERAKTIAARGYYFDFLEFARNDEQDMTPSTPVIPLIYALRSKLDEIADEGLETRYERHCRLNAMVHAWVKNRGFGFFAAEGYRSALPYLREEHQGNRCRRLDRTLARSASNGDRWGIREDQGQDLSNFQHGRRNRGNDGRSPGGAWMILWKADSAMRSDLESLFSACISAVFLGAASEISPKLMIDASASHDS